VRHCNQNRRKLNLENKKINIPEDWKIDKNEFVDLEPNNSYPIDGIWYYFQEDILHATYNEFFIDLGFYGDYLDNRKGFFRLVVAKGDFGKGELYEKFLTRSTEEIKEKLEFYFDLLLKENIENLSGLKYGEEDNKVEYDIYSTINNIFKKLSDEDFDKLAIS
jgi:hypothetical protein